MSDGSSIEWTQATWNTVTGCTKVSPGCERCYIERTPPLRMAHRRFDQPGIGGTTGVELHPARLNQPFRWRKPRRVFVNSLSDLFHDVVPTDYIAQMFAVMAATERHTYQLLTKRPARMRALLDSNDFWGMVDAHLIASGRDPLSGVGPTALPNLWLGVSVEDQTRADRRIPALLATPAAVRWLSCEPLLGPVDLTRVAAGDRQQPGMVYDGLNQRYGVPDAWQAPASARVDWVVVGGESGPGARPMHPDWARSLRDQCTAAGVAYFFKQWGHWRPGGDPAKPATWINPDGAMDGYHHGPGSQQIAMVNVGKKAAGKSLDGRTWDQYPQPVTA